MGRQHLSAAGWKDHDSIRLYRLSPRNAKKTAPGTHDGAERPDRQYLLAAASQGSRFRCGEKHEYHTKE